MRIKVNGVALETSAATLTELLESLGYDHSSVATAVDGEFVPRALRSEVRLSEGMLLDIVAPIQGG